MTLSLGLRRWWQALLSAATAAILAACGDSFANTEPSFTLTWAPEVGTPITVTGTAARWSVQQFRESDGGFRTVLWMTLADSNGSTMQILGDDDALTGSHPDTGRYPVGDGSHGTVLVSGLVSSTGPATSGAVRLTGSSGSTVVGELDVWFGTPGLPAQSALHLTGEFTAKSE